MAISAIEYTDPSCTELPELRIELVDRTPVWTRRRLVLAASRGCDIVPLTCTHLGANLAEHTVIVIDHERYLGQAVLVRAYRHEGD